MAIDNKQLLISIRQMAWNRAKGELLSVLDTYWDEYTPRAERLPNGFENANKRIKDFIKDFEDNWESS